MGRFSGMILDWPRLEAIAGFDPTYLHLDRDPV